MISEKLIPRKYQQEHTSLCWTIVKGNYFAHVPAYVHSCMFMSFSLSLSLLGVAPHCRTMYCMCVYVSCVNVNLCVCVRAYVLYVYLCICECHVSMCAWLCMCDNLLCLESRQSCINTANHTTSHTLLSSYLPASDMRFTIQGGKGDGGTSQKSDVWPFWMILGHNWLHKWLRFKDGFQQRDTWSQSDHKSKRKFQAEWLRLPALVKLLRKHTFRFVMPRYLERTIVVLTFTAGFDQPGSP